jgi:hypothetical protein
VFCGGEARTMTGSKVDISAAGCWRLVVVVVS